MKNAKVLSALGLMSLASTAALAAGGPTLGSVLDASGVKVSGAVAASFRQNASVAAPLGILSVQAHDNFAFDQARVSIAYQPKDGFGGVVDLQAGYNGAYYYYEGYTGVYLPQAFVQYSSGALNVKAGRFYTDAGYEVDQVQGNLFVTRSLTYNAEATGYTGVNASYAASDDLTLIAGVNNSVNYYYGSAGTLKQKTFELGAKLAVTPDFNVILVGYVGKTPNGAPPVNGDLGYNKNALYSLVATYKVTDALSVALNADVVNTGYAGTDADKSTNVALYGMYALNDKFTVGLRLEDIKPKLSSANGTGAVAAVVSYSAAKNFDLRTELSDVDVEGSTPRDMRGAVQGVLKF